MPSDCGEYADELILVNEFLLDNRNQRIIAKEATSWRRRFLPRHARGSYPGRSTKSVNILMDVPVRIMLPAHARSPDPGGQSIRVEPDNGFYTGLRQLQGRHKQETKKSARRVIVLGGTSASPEPA